MQVIEVRGNQVTIDGYVNAVGRFSHPIYSHRKRFIEQIQPGVFRDALKKNPEVRVLFNHNESKLIGVNGKNVQLYEDSIGLRAHAVFDSPEVISAAQNGELRGWSFGFTGAKDSWESCEPYDKRSIVGLELTEVSLLTKQPAYIATTVEVRGSDEQDCVEYRMFNDDCEIRKIDTPHDSKDYQGYELEIELLEKGNKIYEQ